MLDDWRDERVARLERDLRKLRDDMWGLEEDVRRRFWERDQRQLRLVGWLLMGLIWAMSGAVIAVALVKA